MDVNYGFYRKTNSTVKGMPHLEHTSSQILRFQVCLHSSPRIDTILASFGKITLTKLHVFIKFSMSIILLGSQEKDFIYQGCHLTLPTEVHKPTTTNNSNSSNNNSNKSLNYSSKGYSNTKRYQFIVLEQWADIKNVSESWSDCPVATLFCSYL